MRTLFLVILIGETAPSFMPTWFTDEFRTVFSDPNLKITHVLNNKETYG